MQYAAAENKHKRSMQWLMGYTARECAACGHVLQGVRQAMEVERLAAAAVGVRPRMTQRARRPPPQRVKQET